MACAFLAALELQIWGSRLELNFSGCVPLVFADCTCLHSAANCLHWTARASWCTSCWHQRSRGRRKQWHCSKRDPRAQSGCWTAEIGTSSYPLSIHNKYLQCDISTIFSYKYSLLCQKIFTFFWKQVGPNIDNNWYFTAWRKKSRIRSKQYFDLQTYRTRDVYCILYTV